MVGGIDMVVSGKERRTLEGMKRDIEHDVRQVKSYLENKGGLTLEAFIDRVELKAKDIEKILDGTYPWEDK